MLAVVRRWSIPLLGALCAVLLLAPTAGAAAPSPAPPPPAPGPITTALDPSPPGANNWACRPSPAHPRPVVLVHGLSLNQGDDWPVLSPILAHQGYCVFSLTYGRNPIAPPPLSQVGGLVEMERSVHELAAFVDRVRDATGSPKVDLVGHSEGSLMPDYYVKYLGGDRVVDHYVGLTPLWHGSTVDVLAQADQLGRRLGLSPAYGLVLAVACASCREFLTGSDFIKKINQGGAASPAVTYTTVMTRHDELVVPYTSGYLTGAHVTNVVLQDLCPADPVEHIGEPFDPVVAQVVLNALDPGSPRPVHCTGPAEQGRVPA